MTAFHFEAKKYALRQAKDGVVVSFLVHPSDVVAELLSAPIGEHYVVALAPYEEKATEVEQQPAPEPESQPPNASKLLSTDAFWMCRRRDFQEWLGRSTETSADARIKDILGIRSKAELDRDEAAARRWTLLVEEFHRATMPQEARA